MFCLETQRVINYYLLNQINLIIYIFSKNPLNLYWANASTETLIDEFGGAKDIISIFANIPRVDIKGARTPNLQIAGDRTFDAYIQSEISYDNSWPSLHVRKLFPYTLDYGSTELCLVGVCPNKTYPGFIISPITNIVGNEDQECNAIASCKIEGTATEITNWLIGEFERYYNTTRAPLTLMINSAWFILTENSLEAYVKFLDYLGTKPEVFLVSHDDVHQWMQDPIPLANYTVPERDRVADCTPITCALLAGDMEVRYMRSCVPCPDVYPWIGNPTGSTFKLE